MVECKYCQGAVALVNGSTNDSGIAIHYPNKLIAYGYAINGFGNNGIEIPINFCPMCGRDLKVKIKIKRTIPEIHRLLIEVYGPNTKDMPPYSVFRAGLSEKLITEDEFDAAREYYGKAWASIVDYNLYKKGGKINE